MQSELVIGGAGNSTAPDSREAFVSPVIGRVDGVIPVILRVGLSRPGRSVDFCPGVSVAGLPLLLGLRGPTL